MLFTTRRIQRPRAIQFLKEPTAWVKTVRYLGVTLDTRLTWSAHFKQVGRKTAQRLGVLGPLRNRSGLSIRNGVLLYKQLIRPMMDYACPVWRSVARSHIRRLQVLQSKWLRIATNAPSYVGNRQIHEDLRIPFFADHIWALTDSLDSKLSDASNTYVYQGMPEVPHGQPKRTDVQQASRGHPYKEAKSTERAVRNTARLLWLRFSLLFLSCKANAWV
jgi:hypothetical protein